METPFCFIDMQNSSDMESACRSLRLQTTLIRELFDLIREMVFLTDTRLRIQRMNLSAQTLLGGSEKKFLRKRWSDLFPDKTMQSTISKAVAEAARERGRSTLSGILINRHNKEFMTRFIIHPLFDEHMHCGFMIVGERYFPIAHTSADATDISNGLLERMLTRYDRPLLILEPGSRIIRDCNEAAVELFGYPKEELIGYSTCKLYASREAYEEYGKKANEAYAGTGIFQLECSMKRKNGSPIDCILTVLPIFNVKQEIKFLICLINDISRDRRNEQEIASLIGEINEISNRLSELSAIHTRNKKAEERLSHFGATPRQIEIARYVIIGESTKQIAARFRLTESTVKNHLSALFRRLSVSSRVEFVRIITERGIHIS